MSASRWVWALAILSVSVGHATVRAEPVDPDTLVVPEPKASPKRIAADEINQLLRTELRTEQASWLGLGLRLALP